MKKIIPNHIPAKGWKGGFLKKHPKMNYPNPNLDGLKFTDNNGIEQIVQFNGAVITEGAEDAADDIQLLADTSCNIPGEDENGNSKSYTLPDSLSYLSYLTNLFHS